MEPLEPRVTHEEVLVEDLATARAFRRREITLWLLVALFAIATMILAVLLATHWYSGPETARVPGIVGLTQQSALTDLQTAGFSVKVESRESEQPAGVVLDQRPEARAVLSKGSFVAIFVSTGAATVPVPQLTSLQAEAAATLLRTLELVGRPTTVQSDQPRGIVVDQEPLAGQKVAKGAEVFYSVSNGP